MEHFEFVDKHYDDKKIVIEVTEDTIDVAILDAYDPDQINPPNRYAHCIIPKEDLKTAGLVIQGMRDAMNGDFWFISEKEMNSSGERLTGKSWKKHHKEYEAYE